MQKAHCVDQERIMETQEFGIRNRISEKVARSDLGSMERDARFALFFQDQQFTIAVHEHHRQARDAVNQAVSEFSENYKVVMMQKISRYSASLEGRLEEHERRATQVI